MTAALTLIKGSEEVSASQEAYHSSEEVNQRLESRFVLRDFRLWGLKVSTRGVPTHWVHNLSTKGMQLRFGKYQCLDVGDVIQVEMTFMGAPLFITEGVVRWRRPSSEFVNMFQLGIEFNDQSQGRIDRMFLKRQLHKFLAPEDRLGELHPFLVNPPKSEEAQGFRFKMSDSLVLASVVVPFLLGYMWAFL